MSPTPSRIRDSINLICAQKRNGHFPNLGTSIKFSGAKATVRTIRTKAIKYHGGVKDEKGGGGSTRMNRIYFRQLHNKI